jgi:spermidine synthase/SAM-dependent methyltransferase
VLLILPARREPSHKSSMSGLAAAPADELLPSTHTEFREKNYWNEFFLKRNEKAFEWYGDWDDVAPLVQQYAPAGKDCSVLNIGCGNSSTSEEMFDAGYGSVHSIDFSEAVIDEMNKKTTAKKRRAGLKYELMDMLNMTYEDRRYNLVFDKGALDALMSDQSSQSSRDAAQMFSEIQRVLAEGGFYVCITLAQEQIMSSIFRFFRSGWTIHVHTFSPKDGSALCPFLFALQKKKDPSGEEPVLVNNVVTYFEGTPEPSPFGPAVKRIRVAQKMYNLLGGSIRPSSSRVLPLQLWSQHGTKECEEASPTSISSKCSSPRYDISLIDPDIKPTQGICCVCIVPIGREHEWMFASDEGQMQLAESAGFARFINVRMNRGHTYESLESVQKELSPYITKIAPPEEDLGSNNRIPFVTISEDVGFRDTLHEGKSSMSGPYVVEEVQGDELNERCRRLVFLNNVGAIQSEVRMKRPIVKKNKASGKRGRKKGKVARDKNQDVDLVVDHNDLAFEYHKAMLIAFAMLPPEFRPGNGECKSLSACLVGTGGGLFAMFLHEHFPTLSLDTIDLDPEMPVIATEWFGFKESSRLRSHIGDGVEFLVNRQSVGDCFNVVFVDVDSKDLSEGLLFPPRVFLSEEFLQLACDVLDKDGILVINLAARSTTMFDDAMSRIRSIFGEAHVLPIQGDVNKVVFAIKSGLKDRHRRLDVSIGRLMRDSNPWDQSIDLLEFLPFLELQ